MTYIGVYALLLAAGAASIGQPRLRRQLYVILLVALFCFVAFRYEVGCDWTGYLVIYQTQGIQDMGAALRSREPLFQVANELLHRFNLDYPYINVIAAAVYFGGFHRLARRQPDPLGMLILSFPLLILHLAMSGIRQAMAVGILCVAINAFNDRRVAVYVAMVVLAGAFHTSALIFLALTPFVLGKFSPRNAVIAAVIALPGLVAMASGEQFTVYYDRYVGTSIDAAGAPFRTALMTLTGLVFFVFFRRSWKTDWTGDYKFIWISAGAMLLLFPMSFFSSVIADRLAYYFMPAQLIMLSRVSALGGGRFSPLIVASPFLAGAAVLLVWTVMSSLFVQCYVPYAVWPG